MVAFIRYQLISYIRSFRFIAPTTIFLALVFITYAYKNVPISSSYASTSFALYIIMTWIGMTVFSLDDESEKHILIANLSSKYKYFWGKWVVCLLFIIPLTLFSHLFPIITNSFKGEVLFLHQGLSLYSHIMAGLLGVFIGSLFSATHISKTRHAWLLSALVIVITFAYQSIVELWPFLKWILIVFPPITKVISAFHDGDQIILGTEFWWDFAWVSVYMVISFIVSTLLFLKFER